MKNNISSQKKTSKITLISSKLNLPKSEFSKKCQIGWYFYKILSEFIQIWHLIRYTFLSNSEYVLQCWQYSHAHPMLLISKLFNSKYVKLDRTQKVNLERFLLTYYWVNFTSIWVNFTQKWVISSEGVKPCKKFT